VLAAPQLLGHLQLGVGLGGAGPREGGARQLRGDVAVAEKGHR